MVITQELAVIFGLNEAIVLQQIYYWLIENKKRNRNFKEGRYWTFNTYKDWQRQFPFWSISTIRRALSSLERRGIVLASAYNETKYDKTKWYSIDKRKLNEVLTGAFVQNEQSICPTPTVQNEQTDVFKMSRPIPETNTETTSKRSNAESGFITPSLKDKKKKIKDLILEIKDLKDRKITHGRYEGVHPAFRVIRTFATLPEEEKVSTLVEVFLGLFPQKNVKYIAATSNAHNIFTNILNLPMCRGPEEILKEIVYYEGATYTVWDIQKIFKSQELLKNSFARMRYEIDKARKA